MPDREVEQRERFIVLHVQDDPPEGWMPNYAPQVATIQYSDSLEDAACFNVGSYPDQERRGKPYRVIVIPEEHWHEFEVFTEVTKGQKSFAAYPSEHPTMQRPR